MHNTRTAAQEYLRRSSAGRTCSDMDGRSLLWTRGTDDPFVKSSRPGMRSKAHGESIVSNRRTDPKTTPVGNVLLGRRRCQMAAYHTAHDRRLGRDFQMTGVSIRRNDAFGKINVRLECMEPGYGLLFHGGERNTAMLPDWTTCYLCIRSLHQLEAKPR